MKITSVLSQHRSDFTAIMTCEHCGATERNPYGYDDDNYHNRVIPSAHCRACGLNRAGEKEEATP